jgi:hypothetical protein
MAAIWNLVSLTSWMADQSRLTTVPIITILATVYASLIPGSMEAMTVTSATTKLITPILSDIDNNGNWTQVRKASGMETTSNQAKISPSRHPINLPNGLGINGWNSTTLSTLTVSRATANQVLALASASSTSSPKSKGVQNSFGSPGRKEERDLSGRQVGATLVTKSNGKGHITD